MARLPPSDYADRLCEAVRAYDFPAVTCKFRGRGDEIVRTSCHGSMLIVERYVNSLLRSENRRKLKDGLSNVLYWGYANSPGRQIDRVTKFRSIEDDKLDQFIELIKGESPPTLLDVKRLALPQFGQMSFASKIMMFLDPERHPVLDLKLARAFANKPCSPLQGLRVYSGIPMTQRNAGVYERWAGWCRSIAKAVNETPTSPRRDLRAVDVERALFTLAGDPDGKDDEASRACALLQGPEVPEGRTFDGQ